MFKCEKCGLQVQKKQPINWVTVKTREKTYQNLNTRSKREEIRYTKGFETEKEVKVCPSCYEKITGKVPVLYQMNQESIKVLESDSKPINLFKKHRKERKDSFRKPVVEVVKSFK